MKHTLTLAKATHIPTHAHAPPGLLGGTYIALTKTHSTDRSVHIKIHPRPRSLAESAQILGILRSYGEVEVFRHLKYDFDAPAPNSLLVVFKHADSAAKLVAEDKIAFRYGATSTKPALNPASSSASSSSSTSDLASATSSTSTDSASAGSASASQHDELLYSHTAPFPRPGEMIVQRAGLLHLPYIQRQRYYWPVDVAPDAGRPGLALLGRVPPGLEGMRDFNIMRPEIKLRAREGWSRVWDEGVGKRGWVTLNELSEKGRRERKMVQERGPAGG